MHKRGAGIRFGGGLPVWPKTQNLSVGADSIPARGRSHRRRVRRDGASRPTAARTAAAIPVGQKKKLFVGAGFIPPAGVRAAAGFPGRCEHRPLQRFAMTRRLCFPGWPRRFPLAVGADSISARGRSRRRRVRRDGASRPTAARIDAAFPFSLKHKIYS